MIGEVRRPGRGRSDGPGAGALSLPILAIVPVIDLPFGFVLGATVSFLDLAFELVTAAGDLVEIVVSQLSPLRFHLALDLFPVSLDAIPIHGCCSFMRLLKLNARERTAVPPVPWPRCSRRQTT